MDSPKHRNPQPLTVYSGRRDMVVTIYKECLKNHAASFGGHALDGCGEFMPSDGHSSLKCAACGCHRSFHRRAGAGPTPSPPLSPAVQSVSSPVPFSYYASSPPPHLFFSLSTGCSAPLNAGFDRTVDNTSKAITNAGKKRSRTKFTKEQKVKMRAFAEKIGWKMNGCDEKTMRDFCDEAEINREALKIWIHNNKSSANRKKVTLNYHPHDRSLESGKDICKIEEDVQREN